MTFYHSYSYLYLQFLFNEVLILS